MDENYLLDSDTAIKLYHNYAKDMPICDYHCHLNPKEIYENKKVSNITELWLGGDHYKWRLMRSCGIEEQYCTGDANDKDKFLKFADCLQYAIGNPLYSWAHIELKRYFGISENLNSTNALEIYEKANEVIKISDFSPRALIKKSNVKIICTTDDPIDDLKYHILLKDVDDFDCKVLPSFRPDKALNIDSVGFSEYIEKLGNACGVQIKSYKDVVLCLKKRADYFNSIGCKVSDQAFEYMPFEIGSYNQVELAFNKAMNGEKLSKFEIDAYKTAIMLELGKKYASLGWTMELHIGVIRNNNTRMYNKIGVDTGFDSVGDCSIAKNLSRFLDALDVSDELPKTILFNLNDKDNIVLATMLGNFQNSSAESKLQFGPAWWFLDNFDGIVNQIKYLANLGVLGKFVGMETDSRSFTSYARHEYFRRILCNQIGQWVENGLYANDENMLSQIISGISYNNAIKYFKF